MFRSMNHLHIKVGVAHSFTSEIHSNRENVYELDTHIRNTYTIKGARKSLIKQQNVTNCFDSCAESKKECIVEKSGTQKFVMCLLAAWCE